MLDTLKKDNLLCFDDKVSCISLSPYDWSHNVCAIGQESSLIVGILTMPEESENNIFEWSRMKTVHHESRCTSLAFSPETTLNVLPKVVVIGAAFANFNLGIFRSDLANVDTLQVLRGHSSYVNDITWEPDGEYLASVSDDHSLIVWDGRNNFQVTKRLTFNSSATAVRFHANDKGKMLIAMKNGVVRYYNLKTDQIILSFETGVPLLGLDWAPSNYLTIATISGSELSIWNLRKTDCPVDTKEVYEDSGQTVRFSPVNEQLTASVGGPYWTLKVLHTKSQLPKVNMPLELFGGLCWHHRHPYIAVAFDTKVAFVNIMSK